VFEFDEEPVSEDVGVADAVTLPRVCIAVGTILETVLTCNERKMGILATSHQMASSFKAAVLVFVTVPLLGST
jgi:hypothetical protein